jgi:hypothetical protein
MASLITERMRFLHVPKTGGSFATAAMLAAGVQADRPESVPFHADLAAACEYADRFTFAFVRHPLEFWRSYWGYRRRTGWDPANAIDVAAGCEDFAEFIERMIEHSPGAAGALFECYVGPPGAEIDFIARHERLKGDLCRALRLAGEPFDEAILRSHEPVNATDYDEHPARYSPEMAERLAEAESVAIERFYPWDPIPSHLLARRARRGARSPHAARREAGSRAIASSLARRLEQATIDLGDARAQLAALERTHAALRRADADWRELLRTRDGQLAATERRLAATEHALGLLRHSRLIRWSRPLRACWYRLRDRVAHA